MCGWVMTMLPVKIFDGWMMTKMITIGNRKYWHSHVIIILVSKEQNFNRFERTMPIKIDRIDCIHELCYAIVVVILPHAHSPSPTQRSMFRNNVLILSVQSNVPCTASLRKPLQFNTLFPFQLVWMTISSAAVPVAVPWSTVPALDMILCGIFFCLFLTLLLPWFFVEMLFIKQVVLLPLCDCSHFSC